MTINRISKYLLVFTCMALSLAGEISAENRVRIDTVKTVLQVRRPALEAVKSLDISPAGPIDTLDTVNEHVKVVLYSDNTWQYYKTPEFAQSKDVFNNYWDEVNTNPYKASLDSLPYSWSVWLVDNLDQYHCPFQGDIHPRGKFGPRRGRRHQGVDLPLKTGDPIYATFTGRVRMAKYMSGFGNLIVIRHENGLETFYAHLSKMNVKPGDWVNAGDVIGLGGSTGRSTGPHLHFETRHNGFAFDPQTSRPENSVTASSSSRKSTSISTATTHRILKTSGRTRRMTRERKPSAQQCAGTLLSQAIPSDALPSTTAPQSAPSANSTASPRRQS